MHEASFPEEDAGMCKDEELEAYEGWFWISVHNLASLWFCEDDAAVEELFTHDNSWGGQWRTVHVATSLPLDACPGSKRRANSYGFTLDLDMASRLSTDI